MSRVGQRGDSALFELITRAIARTRTITLGVVERFDAANQRVDVQPIVRRPFVSAKRQGEAAPRDPVVPNCILAWPGSTDWSIKGPVPKGSIVLLLVCDRSIDEFRAVGNVDFEPASKRRFDLNDSIAVPIAYARDSSADASPLVLNYGDSDIEIHNAKVVISSASVKLGGDDATDPVVRKSDLDAAMLAIETWLSLHKHLGVTAGGALSGVPETTLSVTTTASNVVKSK